MALIVGVVVSLSHRGPDPGDPASAALGGDFDLASSRGPVSLRDFRGRVVALYFGYTYCPDACPTSLQHLGAALKRLPPDESRQVQSLFITVDPVRDTTERLAEYTAFFHPAMLGLGGSEEQVAAVAKRYGVYYALQREDAGDRDYLVDHTSRTFVVGRDGRVRNILAHGSSPDEVAASLRAALSE